MYIVRGEDIRDQGFELSLVLIAQVVLEMVK